ncbi:hypothetical protein DL767_001931 [Monosporascus sp. MG133]|nr:hypothetical protein DL767_001931 [Monosporascus sp. MG133]
MIPSFKPVLSDSAGHIVDIAFSETLQRAFLGMSDGSIHIVNEDWQEQDAVSSHCATHEGGGLQYLRIITGAPERLVSIASDGSVVIWKVVDAGLRWMRTLHGFHSLVPPRVIACRRSGTPPGCASTGTPSDSSTFLVFATDDGALNWWDLENFNSNSTHLDGLNLITALDIDIDEDLIAVGTASGKVRVWRMGTLDYVFQTTVPGVVTKLAFLQDGMGDVESPTRKRRLALLTNESNLQIRLFDSVRGLELESPKTVPGCQDAQVFDICPIDEETLLVVERDGTVRVLCYGMSDRADPYIYYRPLWPGHRGRLPLLEDSVNVSLFLVDRENRQVSLFLSCPSELPRGICWISTPKHYHTLPMGPADRSQHFLHNARPIANHVVHSPRLNIFSRCEGGLQETPFDLRALPIHGDRGTEIGTRPVEDTDSENEEAAPESPAQEANGDNGDPHTVLLGHPASNFVRQLHEARRIHGPDESRAGLDSPEGDCLVHSENIPLESMVAPGNIETTKKHARFLASLLSGRVWNNDHFERLAQALRDNEQNCAGWLAEYNTKEALLRAERKRLTGRHNNAEKSELGDLDLPELQERVNERYRGIAAKICETAATEKQADTIAVGISPDGKDIYIAGNVKKCETWVLQRQKRPNGTAQFSTEFGLHDGRHKAAIMGVFKNWYPEAVCPDVHIYLLHPTVHPATAEDNRCFHGETQIIAFAKQQNKPMPIIGISKPPCASCSEALKLNSVVHGYNAIKKANTNPMRFEEKYLEKGVSAIELSPQQPAHPEEHNEPPEAARPRISRPRLALGAAKTVVGAARKAYTTPRVTAPKIEASAKAVSKAIVGHPSRRPRVTGGVGAIIESVVDNCDRGAYHDAEADYADAGVYHTRMTDGVYAQAGYGMARAGVSVADVEARGPNVAAGAQFGKLSGISVFAHAELVSAQATVAGVTAKVGLNANTGVSAGADGVSASFLGFGVAVGPHMELDTPVASSTVAPGPTRRLLTTDFPTVRTAAATLDPVAAYDRLTAQTRAAAEPQYMSYKRSVYEPSPNSSIWWGENADISRNTVSTSRGSADEPRSAYQSYGRTKSAMAPR